MQKNNKESSPVGSLPFTREQTPAEILAVTPKEDFDLIANGLAMQLAAANAANLEDLDRDKVRELFMLQASISRVKDLLNKVMPLDGTHWGHEIAKRVDPEHPERQRHNFYLEGYIEFQEVDTK